MNGNPAAFQPPQALPFLPRAGLAIWDGLSVLGVVWTLPLVVFLVGAPIALVVVGLLRAGEWMFGF